MYAKCNLKEIFAMVNRKTWIKAEKYERSMAVKLGCVNVISGIIYSTNPKRIGKNQIELSLILL